MLCRIVGQSNQHLQEVIDAVVAFDGIERISTVIALSTPVPYRVLPLLHRAGSAVEGGDAVQGKDAQPA